MIKKLLRENEKDRGMEKFARTYMLGGKQYVATPHRILGFINACTDVPTKEWEPGDLDFRRLFPTTYTSELSVPDIGKLKTYLKEQKAIRKASKMKTKEGVRYCIDAKVIVNIEFLIDALEAIPNMKLYTENEEYTSPIIGQDEKGNRCFILPINPVDSRGRIMTKAQKMEEAKSKFQELLAEQEKYGL